MKVVSVEEIKSFLSEIPDPEIPVINIADLGILRSVTLNDDEVIVTITPTYSGCPAMHAIEDEIKSKLQSIGIEKFRVETVFNPAWTTDWINEEAKEKLLKYGIAPPGKVNRLNTISGDRKISCPRCGSQDIKLVSHFSSTACKALYKCNTCFEPFDLFKCH